MPEGLYDHQLDFRVNVQPAKAFNNNFVQAGPHSKKRKREDKEENVSKKQKQKKEDPAPTKLSARRSVKTYIHADAWNVIFERCDPSMLFTFKSVSREFREILKRESLWKNCRINNFGEDVPPPPAGLKEYQYLDLLDGQKACMSCGCKGVRKQYWPFLRRWCKSCFKKKAMKRADASLHLSNDPGLLDCIIFATTDAFYNYDRVGTTGLHGRSVDKHSVCLREDVARISKEYDAFVASLATLPQEAQERKKEAWKQSKKAEVRLLQKDIETLEEWARKNLSDRSTKIQDVKDQRKAAYVARAGALQPPITEDLLRFMKPFHDAIQINKPFSEKSWTTLQPKLEERRNAAEAMLAFEKLAKDRDRKYAWEDYQTQLKWPASKEQEQVLRIAREVLRHLDAKARSAPMDYQEFTIRALQEIGSRCQDIPLVIPESFPSDFIERRQLSPVTIHDAVMVYISEIRSALDALPDTPPEKLRLFKCPGCTRNDCTHLYQFEDLFRHIRCKHASFAGDFDSFFWAGPKNIKPLWFAVPWPRNLPLLAKHQKADGKWDPNDTTPYKPPPTVAKPGPVATVSAFEGRSPGTLSNSAADGPADFVGNIIDASRVLRKTPLAPQFKSKIALTYALEKYKPRSTHSTDTWSFSALDNSPSNPNSASDPPNYDALPPLSTAEEAIKSLAKDGDHDLFNALCCFACACSDRTHAISSFGKNHGATPQSREELVTHFRSAHRFHFEQGSGMEAWAEKLFKLPSGEELATELAGPGMGDAVAAFEVLFPKQRKNEHWRRW